MIELPLQLQGGRMLCPLCGDTPTRTGVGPRVDDFGARISIPVRCKRDGDFEVHIAGMSASCRMSDEAAKRAFDDAALRAIEAVGLERTLRVIAPFSTDGKLSGVEVGCRMFEAARALREEEYYGSALD